MKNTNRDVLLDMKSKYRELSSIPLLDEIIARQVDDATMAQMESEFMAELELSDLEELDLTTEVVTRKAPPARKASASAAMPPPSTKTKLVSIRLPGVILSALRLQAMAKGTGYQTLINRELALAVKRWKSTSPPV